MASSGIEGSGWHRVLFDDAAVHPGVEVGRLHAEGGENGADLLAVDVGVVQRLRYDDAGSFGARYAGRGRLSEDGVGVDCALEEGLPGFGELSRPEGKLV